MGGAPPNLGTIGGRMGVENIFPAIGEGIAIGFSTYRSKENVFGFC